MTALVITIPGEIRGKGRPKFSRHGGRVYTDAKTVSAENWVKACAVEQVGSPCLAGPLAVVVNIGVGIPESWSKRKKADALNGILHPTGKPDCDNTCKLLCDALNGIVWRDDSQIVSLILTKAYGPVPCGRIEVRAI